MSSGKSLLRLLASFILTAVVFFLTSCHTAPQPNTNSATPANKIEITVSAAASLQNAFREIGASFERQSGVKVNFNFASSGVLQKQIEQSAPVDVFASAGQQQMDALAAQNLILPASRVDFARNELVLITAANTQIKTSGFVQILENSNARLAVGNPKTVPAGVYAEQTLQRLGVWQKLQNRLILAEDVRQVLDYVARGEVEAGVVYVSDMQSAAGKVREIARAPQNSHEPILYPVAVINSSKNQETAQKFVDAVRSGEGQRVLAKYGFITNQ